MSVRLPLSAGRAFALVAVALVTLAGGWMRLSRLDLMEFKHDEYTLHALALRNASGDIQLSGVRSSIGIYNPPMAVYILSLPALLSSSPLAVALLPAILGTLAIPLCWLLARMWMSRLPALSATLLFALSPWVALNSRKIWAQDLLPFFTILFFLFLVSWMRRGRVLSLIGAAAMLAVLNQVHYSTLVLWLPAVYALVRGRAFLKVRSLLAAGAVALLLWAPFLVFLARGAWRDAQSYHPSRPAARVLAMRLEKASLLHGSLMGKGRFIATFGPGRGEWSEKFTDPRVEPVVFVVILFAGLAAAALRSWRRPTLLLLVMWLALPTLFSAFTGVFFHYLFVTWPAPFLLVGVLFDALARVLRRRSFPLATASAALLLAATAAYGASNALFYKRYMDAIDHNGGTCYGYGTTFRDRMRIARYLARTSPQDDFLLIDATAPHTGQTYQHLYRLSGGAGGILEHRSGKSRLTRVFTIAKPGQAPPPVAPRGFTRSASSTLGPFVVTLYLPAAAQGT